MKDKNPNLEEIEDPHTLGGVVEEDRVQGRGKWSTEKVSSNHPHKTRVLFRTNPMNLSM
jgi:hypothetical protein